MSDKQKGSKPPSTIDELLARIGVSTITDQRLEVRLKDHQSFYDAIKSLADMQTHKNLHNKYLDAKAKGKDPEQELKQIIEQESISLLDGTQVQIDVIGPYGALREMERSLLRVESLLRKASIPWGRAMENTWYARIMKSWERLLAKGGYEAILAAKRVIANTREGVINEWDVAEKVKGWLEVEIIPYAKMIEDVSWSKEDVVPSFSVTLHQPPTPAVMPQAQGVPFGAISTSSIPSSMAHTQTFPTVLRSDELRKPEKGAIG